MKDSLINKIGKELKNEFIAKKSVLSFEEYFQMVLKNPEIYLRTSAQYLLDCFNYFGKKDGRFIIFDLPFENKKEGLVGHEEAQEVIYKILKNFCRQGKVQQLILLYGPNGSAKTTFIRCIAKALEHYSTLNEGAVYTFNWIFPSEKILKRPLGFGDEEEKGEIPSSYAYLDEEDVNVKIQDELKDNPIFLIPRPHREKIINEILKDKKDFVPSETILKGDLSPMSKIIFDALLSSYRGDWERVLKHIQVERFFFSTRYRKGIVTVEPQIQLDASLRQITLDRSLESLPKILQNKTLFEACGDLPDANRGIIEYNDIFKRAIDTYKYLLSTCEHSVVSLSGALLYLDVVFFGSTNEKYFKLFTEYPDWGSFKGRLELVHLPYISNFLLEKEIYDNKISSEMIGKHIAPHTTLVASIFAILTRLRRVRGGEKFTYKIRDILSRISPLDKALLYSSGRVPEGTALEMATELKASLDEIKKEGREGEEPREGSFGASAREIMESLLLAAQKPLFPCLNPLSVFEELERLIKEKEVYEFLKMIPDGSYHNYPELLNSVKNYYLNIIDDEVKDSFGLVSVKEYSQIFQKYVVNISHSLKGEKIRNPHTGEFEEPDRAFMEEMERVFENTKSSVDFRKDIISKIGAWVLSNPQKAPPYEELFKELFYLLKRNFYQKHKSVIKKNSENLLKLISGEKQSLLPSEIEEVSQALKKLIEVYGYCEFCAKEIISHLCKFKYGD